jgi:hypothetical protein
VPGQSPGFPRQKKSPGHAQMSEQRHRLRPARCAELKQKVFAAPRQAYEFCTDQSPAELLRGRWRQYFCAPHVHAPNGFPANQRAQMTSEHFNFG